MQLQLNSRALMCVCSNSESLYGAISAQNRISFLQFKHTHTHLNNLLVAKELATSLAPMPQEAPNAAMDPKTMSQAYAFLRM